MSETKPTDDERSVKSEKKPLLASDRATATDASARDGEASADSNGSSAHTSQNGEAAVAKDADAKPSPPPGDEDVDDAGPEDTILARGNPLQYRRGILTIISGGVPA